MREGKVWVLWLSKPYKAIAIAPARISGLVRVALVATAILGTALLTTVIGNVQLSAQESLGDRARRIRAQKENGSQANAPANGQTTGQKQMSPTAADMSMTMSLVSETDPEKYSEGVRMLLGQERFRVLDDVAAGDRVNKTRFAGGEWKLRAFYDAVASPGGKGKGVVADWNAYRDRLNRWVAQMPRSVTARVSLAHGELLYAWQVRGTTDVAIAPDRRLLFTQKLKEAETVLNQAAELQER
ncbi:MAG TPA: hypothetical protein VE133_06990, partial [Candidatus Sulfotelmatobacter sp.]|nr:hypothetical protein [Candidatus Sulfotelmatobacter sp.]